MANERIAIIDDDIDSCDSIAWLLTSINFKVDVFNDARKFLEKYHKDNWNCILLDIRMPHLSGLQLQEKLIENSNTIPIIMITGHGDIAMAVRAMKNGAHDFITKPFQSQILLESINDAIAYVAKKSDSNMKGILQERINSLTEREMEILTHIAKGKLNKQIAAILNISIKTVELHRSRLMHKMQAKTTAELIKFYLLTVL